MHCQSISVVNCSSLYKSDAVSSFSSRKQNSSSDYAYLEILINVISPYHIPGFEMSSNTLTSVSPTMTSEAEEQHRRDVAAAIVNKVAVRRAMLAEAIFKDNLSADILTEFAADKTVEHDADFTAHLAYELSFVKVAVEFTVERLPRQVKKDETREEHQIRCEELGAYLRATASVEIQRSLGITPEEPVKSEEPVELEAETKKGVNVEITKLARTESMGLRKLTVGRRSEILEAKQHASSPADMSLAELIILKRKRYLQEEW